MIHVLKSNNVIWSQIPFYASCIREISSELGHRKFPVNSVIGFLKSQPTYHTQILVSISRIKTSIATSTPLRIRLPLTKAAWAFEMMHDNTLWSLTTNTLDKILYTPKSQSRWYRDRTQNSLIPSAPTQAMKEAPNYLDNFLQIIHPPVSRVFPTPIWF